MEALSDPSLHGCPDRKPGHGKLHAVSKLLLTLQRPKHRSLGLLVSSCFVTSYPRLRTENNTGVSLMISQVICVGVESRS